ncbi:MAG: hypothetical protein ACK502_05620 [Alphaproteobacteria bacterium]
MYSILALVVTFLQLSVVVTAIGMNRHDLIADFMVYGSPIHLVMHISDLNPFLAGKQTQYFLVFSFHVFKYFFLARAFFAESENTSRSAALMFEIMYLFVCGHYMYR